MSIETNALIRRAVQDGEYASASKVVREALRGWKMRRQLM
ncbi:MULTISPECIES: type II toxin-antitoxin system ParD family antitoxin [unclassified Acidovorax]|nr:MULTISPECIES: type II toxin-antitoxin system ParD family antitoxin [unclassified Acidovorax]